MSFLVQSSIKSLLSIINSMESRKVIIFGPTGAIGSAAARTASELGADVTLAMRDTGKPIPGLDAATEQQRKYQRVQADLTKPETVSAAVDQAGAKYAFIYCAHGSPDGMRASIEALKSSGIELVVFVSSFTIQGDPKKIPQSEVIPFVHARVEINLTEVFGPQGFVAARPGSFATNTRQFKSGIQSGEVEIFGPDATVDCIVSEDIGRVCGTILANGPQDDERIIYLYGPELIAQKELARRIAQAVGKNPKIASLTPEGAYKMFVEQRGAPPPVAKYMSSQSTEGFPGEKRVWSVPVTDELLLNVEKYSGKKATTFDEWLEQNKGLFSS